MRMIISVLLVSMLSVGLIAIEYAYAGCPLAGKKCATGVTAKEVEVTNDVCPMSGKEISKDTPHRAECKGKTIGFCGKGCAKKFKANPDNYCGNIEKEG